MTTYWSKKWFQWGMILFLYLGLWIPIPIEAKKFHFTERSTKVSVNLPSSLNLKEFIKIIATETNTVFIYEEKHLRGKIAITSPPDFKVAADDAFFLFEKLLMTQGLTMIHREGSNVIEIIRARDARYAKVEVSKNKIPVIEPQNEFVMRLIPIKYADLNKIKRLLSPIFSKSGVMPTYQPLNLLIVLDNQINVNRIAGIIKILDTPEPQGVEQQVTLFPIKHNPVKDIHKTVSALFSRLVRNGKKAEVKFIVENRLNSLIIIANKRLTKEIQEFIKEIDLPWTDKGMTLTVHKLKFSSAKRLTPMISRAYPQTKGKTFKIIPFDNLNALIIIATPSITKSIIDLIEQVDVARGDIQIKRHSLKYASAKVLSRLLSKIFNNRSPRRRKGKATTGNSVRIIAESRLNSLIIIGDSLITKRVLELVKDLDIPQKQDDVASSFKLYPLQYAVAPDLAKLLKEMTNSIVKVSKTAKEKKRSRGNRRNQQISISADIATNSLLVFGPSDVFPIIDRIISKLDVQRTQVYVEAMILEVTLDKSLSLGISWGAASPAGKNTVVGSFPGGGLATQENVIASASSHTIGVVGNQLTLGEQKFFSFNAFIDATRNDSEFNILANPQLLMLNNEEASINISTVVPVATNTVTDASGRTTDQIEFRDVGTILTIRPQISGDDNIHLEIKQTASDISETTVTASSNAITTFKRELTTSVVTGNGQTVVLGGLINERVNTSESKIPGLGDLPLIGWLFSGSRERFQKTNLLLFIRPRIIKDRQDLIKVTKRTHSRYHKVNDNKESSKKPLEELPVPHNNQR